MGITLDWTTITGTLAVMGAAASVGLWLYRLGHRHGGNDTDRRSFKDVVNEKFDDLTKAVERLTDEYRADRESTFELRGNWTEWRAGVDHTLEAHEGAIAQLRGVPGGSLPSPREGQRV